VQTFTQLLRKPSVELDLLLHDLHPRIRERCAHDSADEHTATLPSPECNENQPEGDQGKQREAPEESGRSIQKSGKGMG
jgi:hypothetical protein